MKKIDFSYVDLPIYTENDDSTLKKKPFIEHVEQVLTNDLQQYNSFGCMIRNCHTHAGSKLHFNSFIEAELLFHNSYYNKSFATITMEYIQQQSWTKRDIVLIGYETYSEMYLQELKALIKKGNRAECYLGCEYCVYEATSVEKPSGERIRNNEIRNLEKCRADENGEYVIIKYGEDEKKFYIDDTIFLFIVPINTSLSTMDKMVAKFFETTRPSEETKIQREHLCLITMGNGGVSKDHLLNNNGAYFVKVKTIERGGFVKIHLKPGTDRFEYLNENDLVTNFVSIDNNDVNAVSARECSDCFPFNEEDCKKEQPIFKVNRGSVVPMLKLDEKRPLEPLPELNDQQSEKTLTDEFSGRRNNFKRVIKLSKFLTYRHIVRDNNHYQFYIDTEKYLQSLQDENKKALPDGRIKVLQDKTNELSQDNINTLDNFFKLICNELESDNSMSKSRIEELPIKGEKQIFDYLVAPRHESNALWVHLVNREVFKGKARIIHLDIEKEFRSNIKTKYSDITESLKNIQNSGQSFLVRFHYVDDAIYSGSTFLRAKNLFLSLTSELQDNCSLFDSIITLINRASIDTQKFYLNKPISSDIENNVGNQHNRFFAYVNVNISPMRKYEDACTLCKLRSDYFNIRDQCATNNLANICSSVIREHRKKDASTIYCDKKWEEESEEDSKEELESEEAESDELKEVNLEETEQKKRISEEEKIEDRYIFIISHLLNERLSNELYYEAEAKPIDTAKDPDMIKSMLSQYYNVFSVSGPRINKMPELMNTLKEFINNKTAERIYQIAFIKVISRPFFTYHIRFRQAAFTFCLETIEQLLGNEDSLQKVKKIAGQKLSLRRIEITLSTTYLLQTLVKALADMNSTYLIRKEKLIRLLAWAETGDALIEAYDNILYNNSDEMKSGQGLDRTAIAYYKKAVFSSDSLIHYIKKDIILSNDETRSISLENVLLNGKDWFQGIDEENNKNSGRQINFLGSSDITNINAYGKMYLENNAILKTVLGRKTNLNKLINKGEKLYFFEYFGILWRLNGGNINKKISETYRLLVNRINNFPQNTNGNRKDFSGIISKLFSEIAQDSVQALAFVHDKSEKSNILFKYFTLASGTGSNEESKFKRDDWYKDLSTTQAFFHDDNISEIDKVINTSGMGKKPKKKKNKDLSIINDNLYFDKKEKKKALLVRFGRDLDILGVEKNNLSAEITKKNNLETSDEQISQKDESIYVQIWGFNPDKIQHWFALKVLLTLRKDISELIEKLNLQEFIDERKVEMKQAALSINKAATHTNAQRYFYPEIVFNTIHADESFDKEKILDTLIAEWKEDEKQIESVTEIVTDDTIRKYLDPISDDKMKSMCEIDRYMKVMTLPSDSFRHKHALYDKYYQLLTDEIVSAFYRRLIRGNISLQEGNNLKALLRGIFHCEDIGTTQINTSITVASKKVDFLKKCDIHIKFHGTNSVEYDYEMIGQIPTYIFMIILTAVNVVVHTDETEIDVEIGKRSVTISNKCDASSYNGDAEKYWHIPPWLFIGENEEQHITVWTLLHMENAIVDKEGRKISCTIDFKEEQKKFITEFKCKREEKKE